MMYMSDQIDAIYEDGVFRPQGPVHVADGQLVSLTINATRRSGEDLGDIADLLDPEFIETCRRNSAVVPSLEEVRRALSGFSGSVSDLICEEREER